MPENRGYILCCRIGKLNSVFLTNIKYNTVSWFRKYSTRQDRLKSLKLPSLRDRRRRVDMIAVYNVLHGRLDLNPEELINRTTRREAKEHYWRLMKSHAVTLVRRNAFSVSAINDWNSLPSSVVA